MDKVRVKNPVDDLRSREARRRFLLPVVVVLLGWVFLDLSIVVFEGGDAHAGRDILGMVVTVVCACVCLVWLRMAAWIALIGAGLHVFAGGPSLSAWVLPVLYTALLATFERKRDSRLYLAAACAVWVPLSVAEYNHFEHGVVYVTTVALPMWAAHGVGRGYRRWRRKQMQTEDELARSSHMRSVALHNQRREIARDLHDIVAHDLTVISMHAQAVDESSADPSTSSALDTIRSSSAHALQDLRRLLDVLGDEGLVQRDLSDASATRFDEDVERCASMLRDLGFTVGVPVNGELSALSQSMQNALSRILQECTTNVIKHGASQNDALIPDCIIRVEAKSDDVSLTVTKWVGSGVAGAEAGGLGLTSLRERVASFGGDFEAGVLPDGRWEASASRMRRLRYES